MGFFRPRTSCFLLLSAAWWMAHPSHAAEPDLHSVPDSSPMLEETFIEATDRQIRAHRTGSFTLRILDQDGRAVANAPVRIELHQHDFLFGTAINTQRITMEGEDGRLYRAFVLDHFNAVVAENAMKWPQTEPQPGVNDFAAADQIAAFAEENNLVLRGHTLFWAKEKWQSDWVKALPPEALGPILDNRLQQILPRYAEQIRDWDLLNEMMDGDFYQSHIESVRPGLFQTAQRIAPETRLFTNEYGILDSDERTNQYIQLIRDLQAAGAPIGGIGIQEHAAERFASTYGGADQVERSSPAPLVPSEVWRRLDRLAQLDLPIHITEVSFKSTDRAAQAEALEIFYRTAFAHPSVEAFFLWGFWERAHWLGQPAALLLSDWTPTPAAETLSRLLQKEWTTRIVAQTDHNGEIHWRGFFGTYKVSPLQAEQHLVPALVELLEDQACATVIIQPLS